MATYADFKEFKCFDHLDQLDMLKIYLTWDKYKQQHKMEFKEYLNSINEEINRTIENEDDEWIF